MKRHRSSIPHNPPETWGDCFRTAVACLLELEDPTEPPHVGDPSVADTDKDSFDRMNEWLQQRGCTLIAIPLSPDPESEIGYEAIIDVLGRLNPGVPFLLVGTSRTGCTHNVICQDGQIVHDPTPGDPGIVGPASDGFFWANFLGISRA